jgi:LysR family transcriptional regulator, benzoate and cis,cis-muconate-responsive activator of ben and cat genes
MRYFLAVAEELSFTRAAERCCVSQPPLSRAIRELEQEIGARLFERDKHHVSLTAAGHSLVEDARRALGLLEDAAERAKRSARGLRGTLAIGFGGSPVYSLLPALVRQFREAVPDVEIRFRSMPVLRQIDALRSGEIDVGIVRLPVYDELIEVRFVYREPLVVALPLGHPLAASDVSIAVAQLAGSRFVTYQPTRGFNFNADLHALCRLAGFNPVIAHEAPNTESVIGIVACGEGVAIVPASAERLAMRGVSFRPLDVREVPEHLASVKFALAWRKQGTTPTAVEFIEQATAQPLN